MSESRYSNNQKAAIIGLIVTAISGLALLYVNMTTPGGANVDEIIFLGTATVLLAALVPLYLTKVSWSWAVGMVSFLGLYPVAAITAIEVARATRAGLHLSLTIYNAAVVAFYAVATARAFTEKRGERQEISTLWIGFKSQSGRMWGRFISHKEYPGVVCHQYSSHSYCARFEIYARVTLYRLRALRVY